MMVYQRMSSYVMFDFVLSCYLLFIAQHCILTHPSAHPEWRCYHSNSLWISGISLKFGGMMHSTMKQITIWNGLTAQSHYLKVCDIHIRATSQVPMNLCHNICLEFILLECYHVMGDQGGEQTVSWEGVFSIKDSIISITINVGHGLLSA